MPNERINPATETTSAARTAKKKAVPGAAAVAVAAQLGEENR